MDCLICKTCNITNPQEHINKCAGVVIAQRDALLDALERLYSSFQHDGNGRTKGNQAKTDMITYNDDVKTALTKARETIWKVAHAVL